VSGTNVQNVTVATGKVSDYVTVESFVGHDIQIIVRFNGSGCYYRSLKAENTSLTLVVWGSVKDPGPCMVKQFSDAGSPPSTSRSKLRTIRAGRGKPTLVGDKLDAQGYAHVAAGKYTIPSGSLKGTNVTLADGGVYTLFDDTNTGTNSTQLVIDAKYPASEVVVKFVNTVLRAGADLRFAQLSQFGGIPALSSGYLGGSSARAVKMFDGDNLVLQAWPAGSAPKLVSLQTTPDESRVLTSCPPYCPLISIAGSSVSKLPRVSVVLTNSSSGLSLALVDDQSAEQVPNIGYSRIRILNIAAQSLSGTLDPGQQAIAAASFGAVSPFLEIQAGKHLLSLSSSGGPDRSVSRRGHSAAGNCSYQVNATQGVVYTLLVADARGDKCDVRPMVEANFDSNAFIRAVNAWPYAWQYSLSVKVSGSVPDRVNQPSTVAIGYGESSGYSPVKAYKHTTGAKYSVAIKPRLSANHSSGPIGATEVTLQPGEYWTCIFVAKSGASDPHVWAIQDNVEPSGHPAQTEHDHAGLRWLNAIDDPREWSGEERTRFRGFEKLAQVEKFQSAAPYFPVADGRHDLLALYTGAYGVAMGNKVISCPPCFLYGESLMIYA
jgi:hypothetical protein